ncbi:flavin monoamine oxidase family protein [Phenylobacterium sp.]|uniref:flavin monoamine oxidase family protein n=1 Tax=Phenylobacterium sp. TaxID=1871053 RepID=UPI003568D4AD
MPISRRSFLHRVGATGGYGAAYSTMVALGLMATPAVATAAPRLPSGFGRGKSVIILGGGIAGLVSAYELERAGFTVTVLEARDRLGGRNWTLRGGSKIEMVGEADQTVQFSDGIYMNAGPARIPSHHEGLLGYCRKLGVALEVEVNASRSAWLWDRDSNGGRPIQMRQGIHDARGHIAELLAKAVNKGALDQELTADDRARLLPFLKLYGDLAPDMSFRGSERSGYTQLPGPAAQLAVAREPLPFHELLTNAQIDRSWFDESPYMQATMFQPVGGMDRIPAAFERAITSRIIRNAEVTQIHQDERGVKVTWRDRASGKTALAEADFSIITLPLVILAKIDTNFPPEVSQAIAAVRYDLANKIGFEAPRFWERQQIYGGISFVGGETNMVWYPSADLHTERGMLLASFPQAAAARAAAARPLSEQIEMARKAVETLHPGHGQDLQKPAVVNWSKIPFNLGAWPNYSGRGVIEEGHIDHPSHRLLNEPLSRVYFSGAHLSQLPGWQEGAIFAAHRSIGLLADRIAQTTAVEPARRAAAA